MSYKKLAANEVLIDPNEEECQMYILASGKIKLSQYKPDENHLEEQD